MDSHDQSKARIYLVRSRPRTLRHEEARYSGEWTQLRVPSVEWKLLNWLTDRPVVLYVVDGVG